MKHDRSESAQLYSRRRMLAGTAAAGLVFLAVSRESLGAPAKTGGMRLTMYRDPNCGCCGKWADAARAAGFDVTVAATADMHALKARLGVPDALLSCHTSIVGRYVVEGHVPLDAVKRLVRQRPNIKGIAVPGMPLGSPGMEVPSGEKQPFQVMAFDAAGKISVFG